jgi:hypothetical protein
LFERLIVSSNNKKAKMATKGKIPANGFKGHRQVRDWLEKQSREVMVVLAARSALRVWPLLSHGLPTKDFRKTATAIILPCSRAMTASLSASTWSDKDVAANAFAAAAAAAASAVADDTFRASYASYASATIAASSSAVAVAVAAVAAADATDAAAYVYKAFTTDARAIENGSMSAADLAASPLWGSGIDDMPPDLRKEWQRQNRQLLALDQNWQVWTNWYTARLRGDLLHKQRELAFVTELDEDDWKGDPKDINTKLQAIIDRFDIKLPTENEVPKQTAGALHFIRNSDGKIDADPSAESDQLAIDSDALDRHGECQRLTEALRKKTEQFKAGGNASQELLDEVDLFLEALGSGVEQVRPGLLIPRGEALRMEKAANKDRDQYSDLAPLAEEVKIALDKWEPAYNAMVALDPVLARSDQATLGPDAKRILIAPKDGMEKVISARDEGAATDNAVEALAEEAKVAPSDPDSENRNSRRFSEGVKNLGRGMVSAAIAGGIWMMENPKEAAALVAMGVARVVSNRLGLIQAAKWMLANEDWFLKKYSDNEKMLDVIKRTIANLKKLPLG